MIKGVIYYMEKRISSIELVKLIASCFVVFIHYHFPGEIGIVIQCIARFSVPLFFCITGYFCFQISEKSIKKRIVRILRIQCWASLIYLVFNSLVFSNDTMMNYINDSCTKENIAKLVIGQMHPFQNHLWYLFALIFCYIILLVYTIGLGKKDGNISYKYLYLFGLFLGTILVFSSSYSMLDENTMDYHVYRNGLFTGLPFIILGIFIRQYKDTIIKRFELTRIKCLLMIIIGTMISIIQDLGIGSGRTELPIGIFLVVPAIMFVVVDTKNCSSYIFDRISRVAGKVSLIVYIIHPLIHKCVKYYSKQVDWIRNIYNQKVFYPLFIVGCSIMIGLIYVCFSVCVVKFIDYIKLMKSVKIINVIKTVKLSSDY